MFSPRAARSLPRTGLGWCGAVLSLVLLPAVPAAAAEPTWVAPLAAPLEVRRPFSPGPTPYSAGHYGVDLAAATGATVGAAGAGTVTYAGLLAGRGVVVVAHAGGLRTTYEPVTASVALGAVVRSGEPLGAVQPHGHACSPTGPCLHWGLRRGEDYLDPLMLLRRPVRLLPRGGAPAGGAAFSLRMGAPSGARASSAGGGPPPGVSALAAAPARVAGGNDEGAPGPRGGAAVAAAVGLAAVALGRRHVRGGAGRA